MYLTGIETKEKLLVLLLFLRSNCTLLELKQFRRFGFVHIRLVQIVPYWNWNKVGATPSVKPPRVQIVPYWNWNALAPNWLLKGFLFKLYLTGIETTGRFQVQTRTAPFKLYLTGIETIVVSRVAIPVRPVQIVPYWNWNSRKTRTGLINRQSSNCTLLELKHRTGICTICKLRFKLYLTGIETCSASSTTVRRGSSNCTLLELKLQYEDYPEE